MRNAPLSQKMQEVLRAAGWEPGRRIDVSSYESDLNAEGYIVTEAARGFLAEFGGLTIRWQDSAPNGQLLSAKLVIDPEIGDLAREDVQHIEERVGEPLIPIGRYQDYETLLIAPSGKVYGEADTLLSLIADDGYGALQSIIHSAPRIERIPW